MSMLVNIKGLTHIEVLTSHSCPHCQAEFNMVRKVAESLSYVIATETSVATLEPMSSWNQAGIPTLARSTSGGFGFLPIFYLQL